MTEPVPDQIDMMPADELRAELRKAVGFLIETQRYMTALESRIDTLNAELAEFRELVGVHDHKAV